MKRRITISLEADLERIIRNKQANLLLKSNHSVSFSEMLNRLLHEALKHDEGSQLEAKMESEYKNKYRMMAEKNNASYSEGVNHEEGTSPVAQKNIEIEAKLNKVYNRLV